METMTITPIEIGVRLRIRPDREINDEVRSVVTRWLDRYAHRICHFVNRPSVRAEKERDTALRRTYLYGFIDAVPTDSPSWMAHTPVNRHRVSWVEVDPVELT